MLVVKALYFRFHLLKDNISCTSIVKDIRQVATHIITSGIIEHHNALLIPTGHPIEMILPLMVIVNISIGFCWSYDARIEECKASPLLVSHIN